MCVDVMKVGTVLVKVNVSMCKTTYALHVLLSYNFMDHEYELISQFFGWND